MKLVKLRHIIKLMRVHHWIKNILLFSVPLTAHLLEGYGNVVLGFFSFCLAASAVYVMNDFIDLELDRQHPTKKKRPLASDQLSKTTGISLLAACLVGSLLLGFYATPNFLWVILSYLLVNICYSYKFKHVALLDVFFLAGMYVMRALAGAVIVGIRPSNWFISFCLFLFMSLAFLKRYIEMRRLESGDECFETGRGYRCGDTGFLQQCGLLCGVASVLLLCLYLNSQAVTALYHRSEFIWCAVPIFLYWVMRIWFLAQRGKVTDDPVVFALKDKLSYFVAIAIIAITYLAI